MKFLILFSKIFSNILLKNVSNEIGRKSPRESGAAILGIGTTQAILNSSGNVSCLMHLLNSLARIGVKTHLASFKNFAGI